MIKCPHCGSTAQVKVIKSVISKITNHLIIEYKCGCGCCFETQYNENEKGIYQHLATFVTCVVNEFTKNRGHIHCPCNGYDCPYWKEGVCSMYSEEEGWLDPINYCEDFRCFWDEDDDYVDFD